MKTSGVASKSGEQFSTSSSDDNAQVLWENLPDTMVAGSTTQVSIRMKNTGTATWTAAAGYKLGAVGDSDPLSAILRIQLPPDRSVLPGHSHIFNLVLRAPNQPGDYHTDWRMLQEGVRWFGEVAQKTVKVVAAERDDAKVIAMNFPSVMVAGSTHNVSITMRNTGTTTWSEADKYRLGAVGDSDPLSNRGRIVIPPPVRVEPGETHTFNFQITAPMQPNVYRSDWRMVREGVRWFGEIAVKYVNVIAAATDNAIVVTHNLPASMRTGSTFNASVTIKNTGTTTWARQGNYKLGAVNDSDPFTNQIRQLLPHGVSVRPNQTHTFNFTLTAPDEPGNYVTDWRMVREGVRWFGGIAKRSVQVYRAAGDNAKILAFSVPTHVQPGTIFYAQLTVKNTGTTTWTPQGNYKLGAVGDSDPFTNQIRYPVTHPVAPGSTVVFRIRMRAPLLQRLYKTDWQMVREFVHWFGQISARNITVSGLNVPLIRITGPQGNISKGELFCFPNTPVAVPKTQVFTIHNDGNAPLNIQSLNVSGEGFSRIGVPPVSSVPPGGSTTFRVRFQSNLLGYKMGNVNITSNAHGCNQFNFRVKGIVTPAYVPEIEVSAPNVSRIAKGALYIFPNSTTVGNTTSILFTIRNTGNATLNLGQLNVVGEGFYPIGNPPAASVPANGSTTLRIRLHSNTAGIKTARVTLSNNDPDCNPFIFLVRGVVNPANPPEISVSAPDVPNINKDDLYTFPNSTQVGTTTSILFTICNTGNGPLNLGQASITGEGFYQIGIPPATVVQPGGCTTFRIRLHSNTPGYKLGRVSIPNNDSDESPFTFTIRGTVTAM